MLCRGRLAAAVHPILKFTFLPRKRAGLDWSEVPEPVQDIIPPGTLKTVEADSLGPLEIPETIPGHIVAEARETAVAVVREAEAEGDVVTVDKQALAQALVNMHAAMAASEAADLVRTGKVDAGPCAMEVTAGAEAPTSSHASTELICEIEFQSGMGLCNTVVEAGAGSTGGRVREGGTPSRGLQERRGRL